jgi:hypothetical protein
VKTLKDSENVGKTGRVPRDIEHQSDGTKQKLGKRAGEEDVALIFRAGTQHTIAIRWPMALLELLGCRKAICRQLPEDDRTFRRAAIFQMSLAWATVAPCRILL